MAFKVADIFALFRLKSDKKDLDQVDKLIGAAKKAAAALLSVAAAVKFVHVISEVADLGDKLDEMAQKTGASAESIQELAYATGQAGIDLDATGGLMNKLNLTIAKAAAGQKGATDAFRRAGVAYKDHNGKLRPTLDIIYDLGDAFQSMPDGAKKAKLAQDLFSKSGKDMIPVLNQGRARLMELTKEFRESGAEISSDQAAALGKYNDQLGLVKAQWLGVKVQLVTALLPTLSMLVKGFSQWVKENKALIASGIAGFVKGLSFALRALWFVVKDVLRVFSFLADNQALLRDLVIALAVAFVLLGRESILAALRAAAAWVAAALPIILIGTLITAAILLIEDLYSWFKGGDSVIKDWIVPAARKAITQVKEEFKKFIEWLYGAKDTTLTSQAANVYGESGPVQAKRKAADAAYKSSARQKVLSGRGLHQVADTTDPEVARRMLVEAGGWSASDVFNEDLDSSKTSYSLGKTSERFAQNAKFNASLNLKVDQSMTPTEAAQYVAEQFEKEWGFKIREAHDSVGGG